MLEIFVMKMILTFLNEVVGDAFALDTAATAHKELVKVRDDLERLAHDEQHRDPDQNLDQIELKRRRDAKMNSFFF